MIKNEEKTLLKSLNSCKSIISSLYIYDTGSTDNTLSIINDFKSENPSIEVFVKQGDFVDFAISRNVLLEYVETDERVQFIILLDSNDEFFGCKSLYKLLEKEALKTYDSETNVAAGYLLRQRWFSGGGMDSYFNIRLIRNGGWRYSGKVHEWIQHSDPKSITMRIDNHDIYIYQDRTQDCENSFKRFQRDKEILLREHLKNPTDTRTLFYLAQTYGSLGMSTEAYYYYKLRVKYGGYEEERYHSFFRLGEIAKNTGMESDIFIMWWIKAIECLPVPRVEPIIELANYYLFNNVKYYIAGILTSYALSLQYPVWCNLFINRIHYDYTRYQLDGIAQYYLKNYQQGLDSCRKAIEYNKNLITTVNENTVKMIEYKMQFDINNEKNYIEQLEKLSADITNINHECKWYNYTQYELENCALQEFNKIVFNNDNKSRYTLEADILLKSYESTHKFNLLYHLAQTCEKLEEYNEAYFYYKLYIDKILEPIQKLEKFHKIERDSLYAELQSNQIIKKIDQNTLKNLTEEQMKIINTLDKEQITKINNLIEKHKLDKKQLEDTIYQKYEETLYNSYIYLGDIAKLLKMDSSIIIMWWIKAIETTSQPRIEALIKAATYYTFDNIKHHIANMFLQAALKLEKPKTPTNKLHYDYTRYHLNGIVQYYLANYKDGHDSCIKAIDFCKYICTQNCMTLKLKELFLNTKMKTDLQNLKYYIDKLNTPTGST